MALENSLPSKLFRLCNVIAAIFLVVGAAAFFKNPTFQGVIIAVYSCIFAAFIIFLEWKALPVVIDSVPFMFSYVGRGLFYIFLGCINLGNSTLNNVSGAFIIVCGVLELIFFALTREKPDHYRFIMRDHQDLLRGNGVSVGPNTGPPIEGAPPLNVV